MADKQDALKGLNPDQSGPVEKIQNGDPKAGKNRDQRSGAMEAGGPGPSLQVDGDVPAHEDQVVVPRDQAKPFPDGVAGEQEPAGSLDRAGMDPATGKPLNPAS